MLKNLKEIDKFLNIVLYEVKLRTYNQFKNT